MDWQSLRSVIGAATLAIALCACTRAPEPERLGADSERESLEDTRLCERYARAAERVFKGYHAEPIDFLHDADGPMSMPGGNLVRRFVPPWTVRWSCTQRELYLRTRLPDDSFLSVAYVGSAYFTLVDLVREIRNDGLDPRADKLWIVVEVDVLEGDNVATFDPRKSYSQYR